MRNTLKQKFGPPAFATALGLALLTPLALVQIGCSTAAQDKNSSLVPEISVLQFADLATPTATWPTKASGTWAMTLGATTTYVEAYFATTGGTAVLMPGSVPMASGVPVNLTPTATTTYTLTVTDAQGHSTSSTATLTVLPVPDATVTGPKLALENTAGLTASVPTGPTSPAPGTTYKWTATNAFITAGANLPTVTFRAGTANADGSASSATLSCDVTDPANTPDKVTTPKPWVIEVDATPPTLTYANLAPICFQGMPVQTDQAIVTGVVQKFTVTPDLPLGLGLDIHGNLSGTPQTTGSGTYVVSAINSGGTAKATIAINVQAQPNIIFNAPSPAIILPGGPTTLSWTTGANVASVSIVGIPADASLPATFPTSGSVNVAPGATTTYYLTATLLNGLSEAAQQQTVTVNDRKLAFSPNLTASQTVTSFGGQITFNWGLVGLPSTLDLTWPPSGDLSVLGETSVSVPVVRRQSYTLQATNTLPSSATSNTVTVAAAGLDTLAGNITQGGGNHDGTGTAAQLNGPSGNIAMDPSGNVYFTDSASHTVRMATPQGVVTTLAGIAGVPGGSAIASTGLKAQFNNPKGVAYWVDTTVTPNQPYLFVCEYGNNCIRKLTLNTTPPVSVTNVTVFAGTLGTTATTYGNGTLQFDGPEGLVIDSHNNMYVPEWYNQDVAIITNLANASSTVAGYANASRNLTAGYLDTGGTITLATAGFDHPSAIAIDSNDNLYVTELTGNRLRKINTTAGTVVTIAGDNSKAAGAYAFTDAVGTLARLNSPSGVAVYQGTAYVADTKNNAIRAVDTTSYAVSTVIGVKTTSTPGATNGLGNLALVSSPQGMGVDTVNKVIYIAEAGNNDIRKSDLSYNVTNLAGSAPQIGSADSTTAAPLGAMAINPGLSANTNMATMVMDAKGNLYVADVYNNTIRMISPTGVMTTFAGKAGTAGSTDGISTAVTFNQPNGLAMDGAGNLYVADSGNFTVRMYDATKLQWFTIAGKAGTTGTTDGGLGASLFKRPSGICVTADGNTIFLTDSTAGKIRKLANSAGAWTSTTLTTTFASGAAFYTPMGIAIDASGNLYVAERYNYFVAMLAPPVSPATAWTGTVIGGTSGTKGYTEGNPSLFLGPQGLSLDSNGAVYVADYSNNMVRKLTGAAGVWTSTAVVGQGVSTTNPPTSSVPTGTSVGALPATVFAPQAVLVAPNGHDLFITTNGGVAQATAIDGK